MCVCDVNKGVMEEGHLRQLSPPPCIDLQGWPGKVKNPLPGGIGNGATSVGMKGWMFGTVAPSLFKISEKLIVKN